VNAILGWIAADVPDLTGRRAVVTGASSGPGLATASALARRGARVVMTARDQDRGNVAVRRVRAAVPHAAVDLGVLDLTDLASVRTFAAANAGEPLDLLVNNAGVMALPAREITVDGFRLAALLQRPGSRVVTVSSVVHWIATMSIAELNSERRYDPWQAYGRSKLANLLFTRELDARARASGVDLVSVAAHPGYARTRLVANGPATGHPVLGAVFRAGTVLAGQSARTGALPILRAATDPTVVGGTYFGPRVLGWRGRPVGAHRSRAAQDDAAAQALWAESERLTGVHYVGLAAPVRR
jgi:NAD(P)-dependent dehydrogenase (short-subunit alcohol dehydrogenase family)